MATEDDQSPSPSDPNPSDEDDTDAREFAETLVRNGYSDVLVVTREYIPVITHERRLEMIDYLQNNTPESVRAMARDTDYSRTMVSRDLRQLSEIDVVEYEPINNGHSKAPRLKYDHIVIEPLV